MSGSTMKHRLSRRQWLLRISAGGAGLLTALERREAHLFGMEDEREDRARIARETFDFILRCRRQDGSYAPSPDPNYGGESDTKLSDLAAVTYAAVLAKTMGWKLPDPKRSAQFIARHQRDDGRFLNL